MEESVRRCFTWPNCRDDIRGFVKTCDICQCMKSTNKKKYGKLPLKDKQKYNAFNVLTVDLCGLWPFMVTVEEKRTNEKSGKEEIVKCKERAKVWALTMVDEVTAGKQSLDSI